MYICTYTHTHILSTPQCPGGPAPKPWTHNRKSIHAQPQTRNPKLYPAGPDRTGPLFSGHVACACMGHILNVCVARSRWSTSKLQ